MRVTLQIRGYPRYTKHIGPILAHSEMLAGEVGDSTLPTFFVVESYFFEMVGSYDKMK